MAQSGKKSKNFTILSEIYNDRPEKKDSIIEEIQRYFSDPRKVDVWLARAILFVGFFGIVFGVAHFRNQIFDPYVRKPYQPTADQLTVDAASEDLLGLSQRDSDQDGLSDFDELQVYHTSAYLPDSDSDGVPDRQEIAESTDPNCPKEVNCFAFSDLQTDKPKTDNSAIIPSLISGTVTADQIRQLLLDSGTDPNVVNSLSDDEVLQVYQEVAAETDIGNQSAGSTSAGSTSGSSITLTSEDLKNLTPAEVRQLLLDQGGVSQSTLDQISDEELMKFVEETLKEL